MRTKEIRVWLDPDACAVCGRRLLQGEQTTYFVTPDAQRKAVCELCVPRADRARWKRERGDEELVSVRPVKAPRSGFFQRIADWFGGADRSLEGESGIDPTTIDPEDLRPGEPSEPESVVPKARPSRLPAISSDKTEGQRLMGGRGRSAPIAPAPSTPPRNVTAVPTAEQAKLVRGLELFNNSQFPRTVAGLTRSLDLPQVAILHAGGNSVEIFIAWGISWYSYRVDLGDATEPVELSGRGNDSAELDDTVGEWNVIADPGGQLTLKPLSAVETEVAETHENSSESQPQEDAE
ncbi:MAG: hypothetical protein JHC87_02475 [Thermoleophilaceae bacterium]|nr:hypothetical protein [Thermoleophilaceae bacterium]